MDPEDKGEAICAEIVARLNQKFVPYKLVEHAPKRTSEESAQVRGTPLEWGAKTMLIQGKEGVVLMLLYRAHHRISWSKLRKVATVGKKGKMCDESQVLKLGVKAGGVPPWGSILGVHGIIDAKFNSVEGMAFNAGMKEKSVIMKTQDFFWKNQFQEFDITQ